MKHWFSDGHPQKYHIASLIFAVIAFGSAATTTILAGDDDVVITACSYSYSDWGICQSNGKHSRAVTGYSPTGCTQTTLPSLTESCVYVESVAPQCVYAYSSWGICQSDAKQERSLLSKSPSGCVEYTHPVLEQHCTYTAPLSVTPSCSYSYNDWGTCQSNGKRSRTVKGYSPTGCTQTTLPYTVESCSYSAGNISETQNTTQCVYNYSNWGTCQMNGKRTRSLTSKSPSGCVEYTHPTLEQSCIYDSTGVVAPVGGETQKTPVETVETKGGSITGTGSVTPTFSFLNVGEGMTLHGTFEIKGDVRGAQSVEYYLVPIGSNTYKYIGKGTQASETNWNLVFSSKAFPNGEFYLRVKVKNIYGEYGSGQKKITIANQDSGTAGATFSGDEFVPFEMNKTQRMAIFEKMEEEFQIPKDETAVSTSDMNPDQQRKRIFDYCQAQSEKCFSERDSDKDGLSDIDEVRYGTDPQAADSDLDGFIDGDEVRSGFDPVKYSPGDQSDQIVFESPKMYGEVKPNYSVKNVSIKPSENGESKLHLEGKGLPNSFVTIYIYSDPIVLTVKTDSDGNWTYELDKNLEDGNHEAYVAVTDNTGKITAKSEPIAFVKTAQAVTVLPAAEAAGVTQTLPVTQSHTQRDILLLVAIITAALAAALATVGFIKHKRSLDISGETKLEEGN